MPPLDFWLPWLAVDLTDRFLDRQRLYYTPCRIPSRSCESVRYGIAKHSAVVFLTQPASSITRLGLNSAGSTSKPAPSKMGESIWLNTFAYDHLVVLTYLTVSWRLFVKKWDSAQTWSHNGMLIWAFLAFIWPAPPVPQPLLECLATHRWINLPPQWDHIPPLTTNTPTNSSQVCWTAPRQSASVKSKTWFKKLRAAAVFLIGATTQWPTQLDWTLFTWWAEVQLERSIVTQFVLSVRSAF